MTPALDERTQRRAHSRAQAAAILDGERLPRNFSPTVAATRPSDRRRTSRPAPSRPRQPVAPAADRAARPARAYLALVVVVLQLGALVALLLMPAFRVSAVQISGMRLLDRATVVRAAQLQGAPSIFRVDGEEVHARLLALPWVGAATVQTALPNRVTIQITEEAPILHLRAAGRDLLVSASGATLPMTSARNGAGAGIPVVNDARPDAAAVKVANDGTLMRLLAATAQQFPHLFGCSVAALRWTADGLFTITTSTGWVAVIGHLDTRADVEALPAQLTALLSLKSALDFVHPTFGYIDVENPQTPTVGGTPGEPLPALRLPASAPPAAAAPASPGAAATPAPATGVAAPSPSSNVKTFSLPPPSPHG